MTSVNKDNKRIENSGISRILCNPVFMIILTGILTSLPLFLRGVDGASNQDLFFHLSRIEGIKEGLLAGHFPVKMQSVWFAGKGYPVGIYYGDFLLYFPALLRIAGLPVITAYKIFIFVINLIICAVSFCSLYGIFKDRFISIIGMILYTTSAYRFLDVYIRNSVGEYCAFIFFPIIALAFYETVISDRSDLKELFGYTVLFAVGIAGLICTHILSAVISVFMLSMTGLLFVKKLFRKKSIIAVCISAFWTLLLSIGFLVPFMDYYMNVPIYGGGRLSASADAAQIREYGASVRDIFSFFKDPFGSNSIYYEQRMQLTVGMALIGALLFGMIISAVRMRKHETIALTLMSILCLWMSTNLFPWNTLEGRTHLFRFLSKVQFPWRYLAPASLFIVILFCTVLKGLKGSSAKKAGMFFAGVAVLGTVMFFISYLRGYTPVDYRDYSEVNSFNAGSAEYLVSAVELGKLDYVPENKDFEEYRIARRKDDRILMYVKNDDEDRDLTIDKLLYPGYVVCLENGEKITPHYGFNFLAAVNIPKNYEGNVEIRFESPVLWKVAEVISLISLIGLTASYGFMRRRTKR